MLHFVKRATVGTMAARNAPTGDKFEDYHVAFGKIQTASEIGLEYIASSHAKRNIFISCYMSFYKDRAHHFPT